MGDSLKEQRLGETQVNKQGSIMRIVKYQNVNDIDIEFLSPIQTTIYHCQYGAFKRGEIKNPYVPSIFNKGFVGTKYPATIGGKATRVYNTWIHMLERSFDDKCKIKNPTYKDVTCCEKWLNFENFYEWVVNQENYLIWKDLEQGAIDKDIISKGNKIYCPEFCTLVPKYINSLFVKRNVDRGDLPIGVSIKKSNNRYAAQCCINGISKNLGSYATPQEAFTVYKINKEKTIKEKAQEAYSKGEITKRCYEAMMNYEVEITD